jgi:hypothetical protein
MAEKIEGKKTEEPVVDTESTEAEEIETVEDQDKTEKHFSQADVNRVVQGRLKKVKVEFETEIEGYKEQLTEYENLLKGMVEELKKDLPDEYKEILNDSTVLRQYQILSKKQNQVSKKTIPVTPKPTNEVDKKPSKPQSLASWK